MMRASYCEDIIERGYQKSTCPIIVGGCSRIKSLYGERATLDLEPSIMIQILLHDEVGFAMREFIHKCGVLCLGDKGVLTVVESHT